MEEDGFIDMEELFRTNRSTNEAGPSNNSNQQQPPPKSHQEKLLDMQAESFGKDDLADCEVHVGDKIFKVNSYFLCLHSDVFSAYLNSDSVEKNTKTIKINDLDPNFIEATLRFMYCGRVENLKEIAHDLYIVADRYNVKILQEICLEYMFNNLEINHIFNCLELAFQLNIEELKTKSIEFAVKNKHEIQENEEWEPLIHRCPQISITFMKCLTKETDELKKKVKELEDELQKQKCKHHHCRIPHHEILLRHERHLQEINDARRRNDQRNRPFHDQFEEMINRLRRDRERQNLPPLEQLNRREQARIILEAMNRNRFMDNDVEFNFEEPEERNRMEAGFNDRFRRLQQLRQMHQLRDANENRRRDQLPFQPLPGNMNAPRGLLPAAERRQNEAMARQANGENRRANANRQGDFRRLRHINLVNRRQSPQRENVRQNADQQVVRRPDNEGDQYRQFIRFHGGANNAFGSDDEVQAVEQEPQAPNPPALQVIELAESADEDEVAPMEVQPEANVLAPQAIEDDYQDDLDLMVIENNRHAPVAGPDNPDRNRRARYERIQFNNDIDPSSDSD